MCDNLQPKYVYFANIRVDTKVEWAHRNCFHKQESMEAKFKEFSTPSENGKKPDTGKREYNIASYLIALVEAKPDLASVC